MLPILSNDAIEAGLSAVFERIKTDDGEICHEENIGDWANIKHKELNCDYRMVDTDFELLPFLAAYFLDDPIGKNRSTNFLNRKTMEGVSYGSLLSKNVDLVLSVTEAFAKEPIASNLIHIKEHEMTGTWRDSEQGNLLF